MTGWLCPRCHISHSPLVPRCDCKPAAPAVSPPAMPTDIEWWCWRCVQMVHGEAHACHGVSWLPPPPADPPAQPAVAPLSTGKRRR
jgi:hypothetical protein